MPPLGETTMLWVSPPTRNSSMREPASSIWMRSMRWSGRPPGTLVATPDGEDPNWFHSPANLSQLYLAPVDGMGDAVNPWSPTRRRGWNGPYLSRSVVGAVALNDGLAPTGVGGGFEDGVAITAPVPGAADPFSLGSGFTWTFPTSGDSATLGAPYLLFDLDDPTRARVVSAGADGIYTPLSVADGRLVEPGSDDLGLHLVQ